MRHDPIDILILGAGSAGLAALREVRKHTQRFAIVNSGQWGTMCARSGCMPSKLLIEAANAAHEARRFKSLGIEGSSGVRANDRKVMSRVRAMRDAFVEGMLKDTSGLGARAIEGHARFETATSVVIDEKRVIHARRVIVATGSKPVVPEPFRALGARALTTDTLFELKRLPRRVAVLGQGAVGVELAQALSRLGTKVTAFEKLQLVAGLTSAQVSGELLRALRAEYPVFTGATAELTGEIRVRGGGHQVTVDAVLVALGRTPNVEGLGLERIGEPLDELGLPKVDAATMRAGRSSVFFAGDADPRTAAPVLHEAHDEGRIAALNALATKPRPSHRKTPISIVFTSPNAARVGARFTKQMNRSQARFADTSRAKIALEPYGLLQVYFDDRTQVVVGAEMVGPRVEHLAHLVAMAVSQKTTASQLSRLPYYHPTFEEALRDLGARSRR